MTKYQERVLEIAAKYAEWIHDNVLRVKVQFFAQTSPIWAELSPEERQSALLVYIPIAQQIMESMAIEWGNGYNVRANTEETSGKLIESDDEFFAYMRSIGLLPSEDERMNEHEEAEIVTDEKSE